MKFFCCCCCLLFFCPKLFSWGFFAHRLINYQAVFLLPPEMMVLYKPHLDFLGTHAVDPDKRRYALPEEGARHFIDLDHYGKPPYDSLPRRWQDAVEKYSRDSLQAHGIVPWWIHTMLWRLTAAFRERNPSKILKLSADIGHYIGDAHVPLHACSNYNGQLTGQQGIHGFWESRIPELFAEADWDFFIGKADYLAQPLAFIWDRVQESGAAADTVLLYERQLKKTFSPDQLFAFDLRNGLTIRQYSRAYATAYNKKLDNMIERRLRQSIYAVASFWYTAWVNAGQPNLKELAHKNFTEDELQAFQALETAWQAAKKQGGRCEE